MLKKISHIAFLVVGLQSLVFGQQQNIGPRDLDLNLENLIYTQEFQVHTAIRPFIASEISNHSRDSAWNALDSSNASAIAKKLTGEHLLEFNRKKFHLFFDPQIKLTSWLGKDSATSEKGIGFRFHFDAGKKVSGEFEYSVFNSSFPGFVEDKINHTNVVPGQGYAYRMRNGQYRYGNGSGYISYSPSRFFNLQVGHGKNSIGDGHRSLLLSTQANNYSYVRLTTNVWKFKYVNIYGAFKDLTDAGGDKDMFATKFATIHYLSYNISKSVSLGLYEAVIWQSEDTAGFRSFDVNYLNPIIFYRPVEFSLGSPDNVLLGINLKVKFLKRNFIYGQLLLDEFLLKEVMADLKYTLRKDTTTVSGWWANKQAFQIGVKGYEPFKIKGLFYQAELNFIRPYTYTHLTIEQNYGHFGESLAHPLGANLVEKLIRLRYQKKRLIVEAKAVHVNFGADTSSVSYGADIYRSYLDRPGEYGHRTLQGLKTTRIHGELGASYIINPKINLQLEAAFIVRRESSVLGADTQTYLKLGIRTGFPSYVYDY